ncbi:MAG: DUF5317 domain-containing protein [Clostridia bacterium]|nr:DUF5317 domain-containing protein [Clostridia bacterium]
MIILIGIMIALILGKLTGGKFSNILNLRLKSLWIAFLSFLFQSIPGYLGFKGHTFFINYGFAFLLVSYVLLARFLWLNRHNLGIIILSIGFSLNALVTTINGAKMPVDKAIAKKIDFDSLFKAIETGKDIKHAFITSDTKLQFLSDIIYIPAPWAGTRANIVSIGDLFVFLSAAVITFYAMKQTKPSVLSHDNKN